MRSVYSSPELEIVKLSISKDVLSVSDPMETTPVGGGHGQSNADSDPFGDDMP